MTAAAYAIPPAGAPCKRRAAPLAFVAVALLAAAPLAAGQERARQEAGGYIVELAVKPRAHVAETELLFSVSRRDGTPVSSAKAGGHADFSSGGLRGRATLHPAGANRLMGHGLMSAKPDLRIDVTIVFPGDPPVRALFTPLAGAGGNPKPAPR